MSYNLVEIDPISGEHKLKKIAGLSKLNVWTGTQSQYNAQKNTIPNGSYVNITDDAESGNGIKDIYSTDEVKTNKVWIDGKPIYRKVISVGTLPNTTEKSVLHGISSLDKTISLRGFMVDSSVGSQTPIPYVLDDTGNVAIYIRNENVVLRTFADRSNFAAWIIIEYTKTS